MFLEKLDLDQLGCSILSYTVSELIKYKFFPSKTGGAENLDFIKDTWIKFGSNDIDQIWIKSND